MALLPILITNYENGAKYSEVSLSLHCDATAMMIAAH